MNAAILTAGDVARLFQVSPRTAGKWIDCGMLAGWRVPNGKRGGGDRRVTWPAVEEFARRYNLPLALLVRLAEEAEQDGDDGPEPPPLAEAACSVPLRAA